MSRRRTLGPHRLTPHAAIDPSLSRGARACLNALSASTGSRRKGGLIVIHQRALASKLTLAQPRRRGQSQRQITRYVAELRRAGRLEVVPPRRVRTVDGGWATRGSNGYRIIRPAGKTPGHTGKTYKTCRPPDGGLGDRGPGPSAVEIHLCEHGEAKRQLETGAPACPLCRQAWAAMPGRARKTAAHAAGDHGEELASGRPELPADGRGGVE